MSDFCCPYDLEYCEQFLLDLNKFKQELEEASQSNSSKLFLEPGSAWGKECPLSMKEMQRCERYKNRKARVLQQVNENAKYGR